MFKKTISLEDFTDRIGTYIPSYSGGEESDSGNTDYNSWGKLPFDVVVSVTEDGTELLDYTTLSSGTTYDYTALRGLNERLPLIVETTGLINTYILRYGVLAYQYGKLLRFMRESLYYIACKRKDNTYKWAEVSKLAWESDFNVFDDLDGHENTEVNADKLFAYDWDFRTTLPNEEAAQEAFISGNGRYICVNTESEWFLSSLRVDGDSTRYEKLFYYFVKELSNDENSKEIVSFSEPFVDLNFGVDDTIRNIGMYKPSVTEWIPNKRYYPGDRVRFSVNDSDTLGSVYKLKKDNLINYEVVSISEAVFNANCDDYPDLYYTDDNGNFYYKAYYYKGYYNESDRITYFDYLDANGNIIVDNYGNTVHWDVCTDSGTTIQDTVSGISVSHLLQFETILKSCDDNGNLLPFILDSANTENTELKYRVGPIGGIDRVDVLSAITFYDSNNTAYYPTGDVVKAMDSGITLGDSFIGFEYYLGVPYENNFYAYSYAIKYKEIYAYTLKQIAAPVSDANATYVWTVIKDSSTAYSGEVTTLPTATQSLYGTIYKYVGDSVSTATAFDNDTHTYVGLKNGMIYACYPIFTYIDVDYSETYWYDDGFQGDSEVLSRISYNGILLSNDMFQTTEIYTTDSLIGVSDMRETIDINVERGTSSAMERHGALSEVNTMQDLENYKNDMFLVRQN